MGQDVDRTLFSRRDRQSYRSKVQRCLDALTLMLREHPFAHDEPMTGVEVELNLVDGDLVPALRSSQVLDALRGAAFQPELGRWNLELNLPPGRCPVISGGGSSTSSPTSSAWPARRPTRAGPGWP